jgi:hypothetical protein
MKHLRIVSREPAAASLSDIPVTTIIGFITTILTALGSVLAAKYPTAT